MAVDSLEVAAGISRTAKAAGREIGIRAEFDTGFHRCGWPIAESSMLEIQKLVALPGLRWDGIVVYPGHIMGNQTIREQDIERENESMDKLLEHEVATSGPVVGPLENYAYDHYGSQFEAEQCCRSGPRDLLDDVIVLNERHLRRLNSNLLWG